ncbi:uncharacterized protein B0J16DRAFT_180913 [Fusarium flagelliforme]|uniref:uncharacterized protein n=1 Tax=Fusarium flagelliforme TaxID=2675880 RepID=UPI001E8E58CF|nr:uncharacterized protein B0J16DRAFT_180913 [Fusarium flagelliforme]KAH7174270.1 hypothetical protein B0J16DRAFT_180913 [Fusarium flagelliforme]
MSDDTSITPRMRSYGWNFHLLATSNEEHFAGLYQDPKNPFLTFRDLVDELHCVFAIVFVCGLMRPGMVSLLHWTRVIARMNFLFSLRKGTWIL